MKKTEILLVLGLALFLVGMSAGDGFSASAKQNFEHYCAQCHGMDGKGKGINATKDLPVAPRDLTDGSDLGSFTNDQITNTLTKGGAVNELSPIMPPWGNTMTKKEIKELVQYVRSLCKCVFDPKLKRKKSEATKGL
ncbi:MAG: c-type cytochrome [Candidatus Binatia bacterium]